MFETVAFDALPVLLWEPVSGEPPASLVLFLHGVGERGVDGRSALRHGLPEVIARRGGPMRVVVPQCPPDARWTERVDDLARLLDTLRADRVAVTGFSMGGQGVWAFAVRHPDRVSRLAPVAGRRLPDVAVRQFAARVPRVRLWVFHGSADESVPVAESDAIVDALRTSGRRVTYTRYEGLGHVAACETAYSAPELLAWLAASP